MKHSQLFPMQFTCHKKILEKTDSLSCGDQYLSLWWTALDVRKVDIQGTGKRRLRNIFSKAFEWTSFLY
jgi:hypothetical protein